MSNALDRGITVTEMAAMGQPIDLSHTTTAAFVGRALCGPLNTPVLVHSFAEFRRRFGDTWSRSSLGPAAQQFFGHGGANLYIVRVANNARGAMLCLPAGGSALVLRDQEPGSSNRIRVAVDHDGVDADDDERFNLTLQRLDPVKGHVIDQEIFKRASYLQESDAFIGELLSTSALARIELPFPTHRPDATGSIYGSSYVEPSQDGTDGGELSDYDLVGSQASETGLFALQQVARVDLVYLPPPGKGHDLGPTSILAAERFCRQHGAMLIVDPPAAWDSAEKALVGIRQRGFGSPNMLAYFPHMRSRGDETGSPRAVGAAIAGMLCKLDQRFGAWYPPDYGGAGFDRDLVPAVDLDADTASTLSRQGLNIIEMQPGGRAAIVTAVTMGRGSEEHGLFSSLPVRRLYLEIVNAVEQGTRWAVFEEDDSQLSERLRSQVSAYLAAMTDMGAFEDDEFTVECDAGLCKRDDRLERGVTIMVRFQPVGFSRSVSFTLHQSISGSRVMSSAFARV